MTVLQKGLDIKPYCNVHFTGQDGEQTIAVALDDSGWFFTSMPVGTMSLKHVYCSFLGSSVFHARGLTFQVAGKGRTTYIGHLRFELEASEDNSDLKAAVVSSLASRGGIVPALLGGWAAADIRMNIPLASGTVQVEDGSEQVGKQFGARFGNERLDLVTALAGMRGAATKLAQDSDDISSGALIEGGVQVLWGGHVDERRAVRFSLERPVRELELQECKELTLTVDGRSTALAIRYDSDPWGTPPRESVHVETTLEMVQSIAPARVVTIDACGVKVPLSSKAAQAAKDFVKAYESRLAVHGIPVVVTDVAVVERGDDGSVTPGATSEVALETSAEPAQVAPP